MAHQRRIFKVQLAVYQDLDIDDTEVWDDFYFDVNTVIGFRVSQDVHTASKDSASFVYTSGEVFLIRNDAQIVEYLKQNFVNVVE